MFELVSKHRRYTWQGQGGSTILTKQNKVVTREEQHRQHEKNNRR
jgi:hypothetical protein